MEQYSNTKAANDAAQPATVAGTPKAGTNADARQSVHLPELEARFENVALEAEANTQPTNRPAYEALQAAFKQWLEVEGERAASAFDELEAKLDRIRFKVLGEYDRRGGDARNVPRESKLFRKYFSLCLQREEAGHIVRFIQQAREEGDFGRAWALFLRDDDHRLLLLAMQQEMTA